MRRLKDIPDVQKKLIDVYKRKWQSFLFLLSTISSISVNRLNELIEGAEITQSEIWLLECHLD